jgi:hypothetical protein
LQSITREAKKKKVHTSTSKYITSKASYSACSADARERCYVASNARPTDRRASVARIFPKKSSVVALFLFVSSEVLHATANEFNFLS